MSDHSLPTNRHGFDAVDDHLKHFADELADQSKTIVAEAVNRARSAPTQSSEVLSLLNDPAFEAVIARTHERIEKGTGCLCGRCMMALGVHVGAAVVETGWLPPAKQIRRDPEENGELRLEAASGAVERHMGALRAAFNRLCDADHDRLLARIAELDEYDDTLSDALAAYRSSGQCCCVQCIGRFGTMVFGMVLDSFTVARGRRR